MSTYTINVPSANGTLTKGELFVALTTLDPNNRVVKKSPSGFVGVQTSANNSGLMFDLKTNTSMIDMEKKMVFGWVKRLIKEDKQAEAKLLVGKTNNPNEVFKFVMKNLNNETINNLERNNVELKEQYRKYSLNKITDEIDKHYLTNTAGKTLLYMIAGENIKNIDLENIDKRDLGNKLVAFAKENYSEFSHVAQNYFNEIENLVNSNDVLNEKRSILKLENCIKSLCSNSKDLQNKVIENLDESYNTAIDNAQYIIENHDKYTEAVTAYANATTHFNNSTSDIEVKQQIRTIE